MFTYGCSTWVSRGVFKTSSCKSLLWLPSFISESVINWCFKIRCEVHQTASGVKGSSLPLNISVTLPLKVKRNVLITFIRLVLLLMFLSLAVFKKTSSSHDLTFHRVSFTNTIYICVCFRYLTIYFKLLGIIKLPFSCWVVTDRHNGPMYSNAHR